MKTREMLSVLAVALGATTMFGAAQTVGASGSYDVAAKELKPAAFFAHASVGWDQNPRCPPGKAVPTVLGSTPAKFEVALRRAKDWTDRNVPPSLPKLITINSWNEWTEGSYLEPDQHFGFGYLEAIRRVFCPE